MFFLLSAVSSIFLVVSLNNPILSRLIQKPFYQNDVGITQSKLQEKHFGKPTQPAGIGLNLITMVPDPNNFCFSCVKLLRHCQLLGGIRLDRKTRAAVSFRNHSFKKIDFMWLLCRPLVYDHLLVCCGQSLISDLWKSHIFSSLFYHMVLWDMISFSNFLCVIDVLFFIA